MDDELDADRHPDVRIEAALKRYGQIGIVSDVRDRKVHAKLAGDAADAAQALDGVFCHPRLVEIRDAAGKRDDSVFDGHADIVGTELRIAGQLLHDLLFQIQIFNFHFEKTESSTGPLMAYGP